MEVTKEILKDKEACKSGLNWFVKKYKNKSKNIKMVVIDLLNENHWSWANWLVTKLMDKRQAVSYAIFSAEQVIDIFEKKYPKNKLLRKAIEAAKSYLKNSSNYISHEILLDAEYAFHIYPFPFVYAAYSAYYAFFAADSSHYYSSYACDSADSASEFFTNKTKIRKLILDYGIKLIEERTEE